MIRPIALVLALVAAATGGWGVAHFLAPALSAAPAGARHIQVWKSQSCGCCTAWIAYVEDAGYRVEIHDVEDVDPIKDQFGVPDDLRACHTARLAGYVVEGHVPVAVLDRLLNDRPAGVRGVAVPDMPPGAPGMDEDDSAYEVVTFGPAGTTRIQRQGG